MKLLFFSFATLFLLFNTNAQTILLKYGSKWKYKDNGSNQMKAWRQISFNDSEWKTGYGKFGYGNTDDNTTIKYGTDKYNKYITTYLRKKIYVKDAAKSTGYLLHLKRDDGALVYVNGRQVFRTNLPTGIITYTTLATKAKDDGTIAVSKSLPAGTFVEGENTIAVEIHQHKPTDVDITFDLQISIKNAPAVAMAGADQTLQLPTNYTRLDGSKSYDPDGNISSYKWLKLSGPSQCSITNVSAKSTTVSNLVAGSYVFQLIVKDNVGVASTDEVKVTVNAASAGSAVLTRGPYLQMANESAITLRWRTDKATDSKISVGKNYGNYTLTATNGTSTTEHEVRITGLAPDTKYYYSFGSSKQVLQSGTNNYFITAPGPSVKRKMRFAAFGDCGRNENNFQTATLDAYRQFVGSSPAELMLLLGDNAYAKGTDAEYSKNFFKAYDQNILQNHVVFPTPGNHDYASSTERKIDHDVPYYEIFTMPSAGECGGVASGTEAFYSYNWGNIHFLSLDSYGYETGNTRLYDTLGPQVTWIKKDLAANSSKWTIAYWHHPPYTMGSHNSDSESELVKIRQRFIGILERNGVDLVLCGHSHDYERSYLLKGYTGNESSFNVSSNAVTSSSGKYNGSGNSCPYNVPGGKVNHGTVYVVAGSSGADGGIQSGYPHNAMPFSVDDGGMLYFEVENNRLDAKFIRRDGHIADQFTMVKDAGKTTSITSTSGKAITLTASWPGNYKWSTGATTKSITVSPTQNTTYSVSDGVNCLKDKFNITVSPISGVITMNDLVSDTEVFTVYPIPVKRGQFLQIKSTIPNMQMTIFNEHGQGVRQIKVQHQTRIPTSDLPAGIYYLRGIKAGKEIVRKIIIMD